MSLLKKLAGQTVLYGLSTILGRILSYLLTPLYTDLYYGFPREEFGLQIQLFSYIAFLNIIYTYGMETTFFRFASHNSDKSTYRLTLSSLILSTIFFSGLLILFSPYFSAALSIPDRNYLIIWLVLIISIDTILVIPFARLRLENRARKFALLKTLNIVLNVGLNFFFLVFCRQLYEAEGDFWLKSFVGSFYDPQLGIGYVFLSNLIANGLMILLLYRSFLDFRFYFSWKAFRPLLIYAYPLIFTGLAAMVNSQLANLILEYRLPEGLYEGVSKRGVVGIYGACARLAVFMNLVVQAFKYAAEPFFFAQARDKEAPELFAKVMYYFVLVTVFLWIVISVNLDVLKFIFLRNEDYHIGIGIVPILLLANLLLGVYYNLSVWFKLTDRTYFGTYISIAGALVTIIFNYSLIPILGYYGSALTALLAYTVMVGLCYWWGQQYFPIPYRWGKSILHILMGSILIYIHRLTLQDALLWNVMSGIGISGLFLGLIYGMEKQALRSLFAKTESRD